MNKEQKVTILTWGNNASLQDAYMASDFDDVIFKKKNGHSYYLFVLIDLDSNQNEIQSQLYQILNEASEAKQKVLIGIFFSSHTKTDEINRYPAILQSLNKKNLNKRIVLIKDLYTAENNESVSFFDKYIKNALKTGEINIGLKALNIHNPQSLKNTIKHIKKLLYLNTTQDQVYYIETGSVSETDIAYSIKKIYEECFKKNFDIEAINKDYNGQSIHANNLIKINDPDTFDDFENDLKLYINKYLQSLDISNDENVADNQPQSYFNKLLKKIPKIGNLKNKKEKIQTWALKKIEIYLLKLVFFVLSCFLISSITFVASSYYTIKSLQSVSFYLRKGDIVNASHKLRSSEISYQVAIGNYHIVSKFVQIISPRVADMTLKSSNFLELSIDSFRGVIQTYGLVEKVYQSLNVPGRIDYIDIISAVKTNLQREYESLNQLELLLEDPVLPSIVVETIRKNDEFLKLKETKNSIWEISKILDVIPEILGSTKNSNTFILLQNNHQLKSTGGTIDQIMHISLDNGKLIFFKSYKPQEIDKGDDLIINAPPLVEKVTGDTIWRLRDMNYNPDFPQTAVNIAWYLEKKLKTKPDFIVTLNTDLVGKFLGNKRVQESLGVTINEAEYQIALEKNQNQEEIIKISEKIIQKALNREIPLIEAIDVISKNFKNIYLWSSNQQIQQMLYNHPLAGGVNAKNCLPAMASSRKCLSETIHLNISNFSNIPINNNINRSMKVIVTPQVLGIDHQIILETKYSKQALLINRNLVEILQLYLNKNSKINAITLNDNPISLEGLQTQIEGDLLRHQFIVSTELNKDSKLVINYSTSLEERTILPIAYSYSIIPQSGLNLQSNVIEINLPDSSRVSAVTTRIDNQPGKITVNLSEKNSFGFNLVAR